MRNLSEWRFNDADLLGRGSSANCYRCSALQSLQEFQSIKVFHDLYAANFLQAEVNALQALGPHAESPALLDYGRDKTGRLCIVTKLAQGTRLDRHIRSEGLLPLPWVNVLVSDLLRVLAKAHGQGYLHKDIKAENIVFDGQHFKLLDWGSAERVGSGRTQGIRSRLDYLAPECFYGFHSVATDFYALGCLVAEIATGVRPYMVDPPGNHDAAVAATCLDMPQLNDDQLQEWYPLVRRWLSKEPSARPVDYDLTRLMASTEVQRSDTAAAASYPDQTERGDTPYRAVVAGIPYAQCQRAMELLHEQHTDDALRLLEAAAARGYGEAQYRLGRYLLDGTLCPANAQRARQLLAQSAQGGHAYAQYSMSHICAKEGDGDQARTWLQYAAQGGYDRAQYDWGLQLEKEAGHFQDALALYVQAADRGNAVAQRRLVQFRAIGVTPVDDHATHFFWQETPNPSMPRIFVSVASYRDPETPHTLRDMFSKATHPDRIYAGVFWQVVPGDDDDCTEIPVQVPVGHVRSMAVHPRESKGACWARSRILTELRGDEDYVLQIDSHMRFVADWDEKMISMLQRCETPRALLSTYPIEYKPPDERAAPSIPLLTARKFNHRGILMPLARALDYSQRPSKPLANPFLSAGFLFGPAAAFDEVPYDPHLYFIGEEISLATRLWTHGWNVYSPDDVLIYHFYGQPKARPRHWADNPDWVALDNDSFLRLRHLFGIERTSQATALIDLQRYGLGAARTLEEFEHYADVDLRRQTIGAAGACGHFPAHPEVQTQNLCRVFEKIYQANTWQSLETRSGMSSTLIATANMRGALAKKMEELQVRTLVDAGCGDVNWMAPVSSHLDLYFGIDIVHALIAHNLRLAGQRPGHFFAVSNIAVAPLPSVDAILCRQVLEYLPLESAHMVLANVAASGSRWFIASTEPGASNRETSAGDHRALDLCRPPFNLPPPNTQIPDGERGVLAVWAIYQLPKADAGGAEPCKNT